MKGELTTMSENTSPQYIRTHKAICQALVQLLKDKAFERITVQDILDATPVTRTTFYKHFHDKYEVAEYMQEQYIKQVYELTDTLGASDITEYSRLSTERFKHYVEQVRALCQIRTERVDLHKAISSFYKKAYYEKTATHPDEMVADIYANAMATFQLQSVMQDLEKVDTRTLYNTVMIDVCLLLLSLENDKDVKKLLFDKVNHLCP